MTSTPPRGARRRRPVLIPVVVVLAAATVGVSAALGGLEQAPKRPPEQLGKGAEVDQGQMRTVFEDAVVRSGAKYEMGAPSKRYLQIVLKVTNQSDRTIEAQTMDTALPTVRADATTIKPSSEPGDSGPYIRSISKDHPYSQLQPGVPTTVILSFEMKPGDPVPKKVRIDAATYEWHRDFFTQKHYWQRVLEDPPATPAPKKTPTPTPSSTGTEPPRLGLAQPQTQQLAVVSAQVDLPVRVETS
ncbi:hypothetical protein [Sphaerisporangium dianthi]|uniref:DUF4352 domain-containing protein n=1 Tax=Sphaerisporangium dianthi TaxID=1436120 RepID=A0ABV9CAR9_9ACTN